jgi:spectrin alpha
MLQNLMHIILEKIGYVFLCYFPEELHRLWELLLSKLAEKGMKLQQALVLVQFLRQCDEVMFWINDKETFVTTDEFGHDLEHVEVLQRKFDEFQKDMVSQEYRVTEVNELADKLVVEGHPERDTILRRKEVSYWK